VRRSGWWQNISAGRRVLIGVVLSAVAIAVIGFFLDRSLPEPSWSQRATTTAPQGDTSAPTVATTTAPTPATTAVPATTSPPPATGHELYDSHCASCHGTALEGGLGPRLDRGSDASELSDRRIELRVLEGRNEMPAFETVLTPEQIDLIIRFVRDQQSG
jgi:mono/diheme cytochrome c family protein